MPAATPTNATLSARVLSELKVRHLANFFVVCTVTVVLGMTLYPFDFTTESLPTHLPPFVGQGFGDLRTYKEDILTNIFLFLPVGFAFGILAARRTARFMPALILATLAGGLMSLLIESLQLFLPFRYPSLLDVASNAAGAAFGYVIFKISAPFIYRILTRAIERANSGHAAGWLMSIYLIYLMCLLAGAMPLQQAAFLAELNKSTFPLVVGNEPTGSRWWTGSIAELVVAKYPFSTQGVADYLDGREINPADSQDIVAHYVFKGRAPYPDRTRLHSHLDWRGRDTDTAAGDAARVSPKGWLQTGKEAYNLSSWMMETLRFTICLTVASRNPNPPHISRIVAVASDPYRTNIGILQSGNDLGICFRSMMTGTSAMNPQFIVPDVFADTLMHRIVVMLAPSQLLVYVDNLERTYQIELGPGFAFLNKFFPSNGKLSIASRMKNFHRVLFFIIVFVPLGYILALLVHELRRGVLLRVGVACLGIAAPPYLLETVLCRMIGREVNMDNLSLGLALMFGAVVITLTSRLYRRRSATASA